MSANGVTDLRWRLSNHLLPAFAAVRLDEITVEMVDAFRARKVREAKARQNAVEQWHKRCAKLKDGERRPPRPPRPLSAGSINKLISTLAAILEVAVEYGHIARNPARGRRRKLAAGAPRRTFLDRAEHIAALLDAAGELDMRASTRKGQRRALLATLVFAGPRISECLDLRWGDVNLADGRITIRGTKTMAAARKVTILPVLHDELSAYRARLGAPTATERVFPTGAGGRESESNVRNRVLAEAVAVANEQLAAKGDEPLPGGLSPHSLRRTFASLLVAIGKPPPQVKRQMGHTTAHFTMEVYAQAAEDDSEQEMERLRRLVDGSNGHGLGSKPGERTPQKGLVAAS